MLTLIGRELQDHLVHIVLAGLVSLGTILVAILIAAWGLVEISGVVVAMMVPVLLVIFSTLGTVQMYADRANRISALLATTAVTRSRILAGKVLAGVAIIAAALVPLLIMAVALLYFTGKPLAFYWRIIAKVFTTAVLAGFACHCAGLLLGWTTNKMVPVLSVLFGTLLVVLLVVVKGFGLAAIALLLLFSVAALLRVWHEFTSVSL
jgi:ABC-type transport system involved in multi-copper enzyme maturation permease subunit